MGDFPQVNAALESLGYLHNGDQDVPGLEVFKLRRSDLMADELRGKPVTHHLYVCPADRSLHLTFLWPVEKKVCRQAEYAWNGGYSLERISREQHHNGFPHRIDHALRIGKPPELL